MGHEPFLQVKNYAVVTALGIRNMPSTTTDYFSLSN